MSTRRKLPGPDDGELYKLIVESARDFAIITFDTENRVATWNSGAQRILRYSKREALGISGAEFFTPEDRATHEAEKEIATARKKGRAEDERWHLRKDRSRFWGSGLMMPLRGRDQEIIGYLKIFRDLTERKEAQDALEDLNGSLEKRVLDRTAELVKSQNELKQLTRQLSRTERLERERIATDLHDHLGQILALAQMKLAAIQKASSTETAAQHAWEVRTYLDDAVLYTRSLLSSLSPPIGKSTLANALKWLAQEMKKHGLTVTVKAGREQINLHIDMQTVVFQSVRELLFNVLKHSQQNKAAVTVRQVKNSIEVVVEDKGVGFEKSGAEKRADPNSGFGLYNVAERLKVFDGSLAIDRQRQRGTKITITVPAQG